MTRKDYELIAGVLFRSGDEAIDAAYGQEQLHGCAHENFCLVDKAMRLWQDTCEEFANKLAEDNVRFNAVVFLEACGMDNLVGEAWRVKYTK